MKRLAILAAIASGWIAAAVLFFTEPIEWRRRLQAEHDDAYDEGFADGERQAVGS